MKYRRTLAAVGLASVFALAACGAEDQVAQPASKPASAAVAVPLWPGDAKDHPNYGRAKVADSVIGWPGDAKDHPGYGQIETSAVLAVRRSASPSIDTERVSLQAELTTLAQREGLTGLSPAYLQDAGTTSGPPSTLPGNPR